MSSNRRKPHPGTVDGSRQNLFEGSELLRERRLEVEAELDLGIHRKNLFPVLSGDGEKKSGSLTGPEHVGPQLAPSDLVGGDVLDGRPIHRLEESLPVHPVRDELLADTLGLHPAQKLRHAIRKRGLPAGDLDGALQRDNVVCFISFHNRGLYKRACEMVNKSTRMTPHKAPCTVLHMPAARKKVSDGSSPKKPRKIRQGADGRTANDRFREAFNAWISEKRPRTQMDLVRACNVIAGRPPDAEKDYVSQQIIDQIKRDELDASRSAFLDVLAEALGVRAVWLRLGVGPKHPERAVLDQVRELVKVAS